MYKRQVSDIEFKMPQPSYTIDTLVRLQEKHPNNEYCLIMGSDNLTNLNKWKNHKQILEEYPVFVYPRRGTEVNINHQNIHIIKNKSNKTPRASKIVIFSLFLTNPKPAGPNTIPARIYPITAGWRNLVKITPQDKATSMTTASGINCSWASIIRLI